MPLIAYRYVWSMRDPMAPVLVEGISMKSRGGAHWLTFDIEGNYAYVAPNKSSDGATRKVKVGR
jgi:hypothetical protein